MMGWLEICFNGAATPDEEAFLPGLLWCTTYNITLMSEQLLSNLCSVLSPGADSFVPRPHATFGCRTAKG